MKTGKKTFIGFLSFALTTVVLVLTLKIVNWIPGTIQSNALRRYASIDEVRSALNIQEIRVPTYFPEYIVWPPSEILAQGKPFPALVMMFKRAGKDEIALVLSQSQGQQLTAGNPIEITTVKETVPFTINGKDAVLTVGECGSDEPCSMIAWKEGEYAITAAMRAAPFELSKIVASMNP